MRVLYIDDDAGIGDIGLFEDLLPHAARVVLVDVLKKRELVGVGLVGRVGGVDAGARQQRAGLGRASGAAGRP